MRDDSAAREIERQRARLATLSRVSRRITESWDLDTVLQEVVDGARSLTDARYGAVGVFDEDGRVRKFITSGITPEQRRLLGSLPKGQGILGYLNEIQKPLRLGDLSSHCRSVGFPENHPPMKTFLGAPIRHLGKPVGNIYLTEKEGGEFSEEDEETLVMFASQAAIAISNVMRHEEEQQARNALETERRRLVALVESSPVGVMVVDAATRTFAWVNQEAERILGMSPEPGSTLVDYHQVAIYRRTDGKRYEDHDRPLARALDRGEVVRAEEILVDLPGGRKVTTLVNATPIYSDAGGIVSAIAVVQDMTPLEEMERLRNEFLAMVSHELRTPLTTIKGCTGVVLGSSEPLDISELLQYFRMIDEQSDHLRGLVNNLLDMTRIEAGALSVTPKPTEVASLVSEAKTAFLRRGARHTVDMDLDVNLPMISADGRRITQVLDNLLTNASKYSPEFSRIRITGTREGFFVVISVTDEGRGIPTNQLARLFKKFSRLDDREAKKKVAGEGLGLAICRGIVEAHGGRIWAESDGEGCGTRISFAIPEATDVSLEANSTALVSAQVEQRKILAVDDEPQVLWLLRNILSKQGYKLLGASNAEEMMHLLDIEQPHLVLLDLMLPGTSGFQLMERIREVSEAPIIFLSANDQEENVVKALEMGADDYMIKPFSSTELLARIASSLRKQRPADTPVSGPFYHEGDLRIDYAQRSVSLSGNPVHLSALEYKLLSELSTNAGRTLTQLQILQRVWGKAYSTENELLRATVKNLRRKLGDDANNPRYIFTEPRVGYRMAKEGAPIGEPHATT